MENLAEVFRALVARMEECVKESDRTAMKVDQVVFELGRLMDELKESGS